MVAAVAETSVGAVGGVAPVGVTALDSSDAGPEPFAFEAVTRNVYCVPPVSPVTVASFAGGEPVTTVAGCASAPAYGVIVYVVGGPPAVGEFHVIVAELGPPVAWTCVTMPGTGVGTKSTSTQ